MAATTTLLGLVTPTQGTLTGTWGDTVNYGISDYLDIAIAGTLSFAGDGAITLANTTGSSSGNSIGATTAQYMVIRVTGTQTITKIITGPSYSKLYMVDHAGATSAVTFKAAGQTGVSVAVGEKCFVYYNGTDYVKVASSVADGVTTIDFGSTGLTPNTATSGAVTVAGTLAVANGGTGVTTSTGTTNVVLSNSPTLVTPALGVATATSLQGIIGNVTPAAGTFTTLGASSTATLNTLVSSGATLTGGTINGMTVGATTASTGAFTTVTASSTISAGANISTINGAGYLWDTGAVQIYSNGTYMRFRTGSTDRLELTNAGLAVTGTLSATGTLSGGTSGTAYSFSGSAPATSLTLDSSGNLGVGTSSPLTPLHVVGAIQSQRTGGVSQYARISNTGGTATFISDNQASGAYTGFVFQGLSTASGTPVTYATIDGAGNLGLGVTPSAWDSNWKVYQAGSYGVSLAAHPSLPNAYVNSNCYYNGTNWTYTTTASTAAAQFQCGTGAHSWFVAPPGTAGNPISFTQAMTLNASGNLGIGTTSPKSVGNYTFVTTNATTGSGYTTYVNGTEASNFYANSSATVVQEVRALPLVFETNATERARIDSSGNFGIATTSPSYKLSVGTGGVIATYRSDNTRAGLFFTNGDATILESDSTNSDPLHLRANGSAGRIQFFTNTTERARIDSAGMLSVNYTSVISGGLFIVSSNATKGSLIVRNDDSVQLYSLGTGTVTCSSGVLGFTSDERIKIDDGNYSGGLNAVLNITPKYFYYKNSEGNKDETKGRELGFFAQNIQQTCGLEVVHQPEDPDALLGIHDRGVMAVLVSAIKEQQALITQLTARITALESA